MSRDPITTGRPARAAAPAARPAAASLALRLLALGLALTGGAAQATESANAGPAPATVVARFTVGSGDDQIGVIAQIADRAPEGPAAIATSPQGEVFVLDTVNARVRKVLPPPSGPGFFAIPQAEQATDLVVTDRFFYVLDALGRQVLKYDDEGQLVTRVGVDDPTLELGGSVTLAVLPNDELRIRRHGADEVPVGLRTRGAPATSDLTVTTPAGVVESRFQRASEGTAAVSIAGTGRAADAPSDLKIESQHFLASGQLLGVDDQGRYYVLAEEMARVGGESVVHTVLARYAKAGNLGAVADVPLDAAVYLPNRYVALGPRGQAYFLQPGASEVLVLELPFVKRATISPDAEALGSVGASRAAPPLLDDGFEGFVRGLYPDDAPLATRGTIRRARILENARGYLELSWRLAPSNYERGATPSRCDPPGSKWRRPTRLDGKVSQQVRALPYRWGGYESLQGFQDKLERGFLAGDVCTCRDSALGYCITPEATGVDCSGFVSRTLEEKYYTTSSLHKITNPLPSLRDLKPGDILNRAGNHVRLFVGFAEGGPLAVKTIESAVSCGGICAATYTVSQLAKYVPLRYRYVED